jgi:hypothetical protein
MKLAAIAIVALLILAGITVGQEKRATITGFPPYALGSDQIPNMTADLTAGSAVIYTSRVPTVRHSKRIQAALGSYNYSATLTLEFWNDKIAVISIDWPSAAFSSMSDWRNRSYNLRNQLVSSYSDTLVKQDIISDQGGAVRLKDAQGNQLIMLSSYTHFDISLIYLWGPYGVAVDDAPVPATSH